MECQDFSIRMCSNTVSSKTVSCAPLMYPRLNIPLLQAYHGHLTPSLSPGIGNLTLDRCGSGGFDTKPRKVGNLTVRTRRAKRKCY